MNETSLFPVEYIHMHMLIRIHAFVYIWNKRESLQCGRVANCVDKLFTFRSPAMKTKWFNWMKPKKTKKFKN